MTDHVRIGAAWLVALALGVGCTGPAAPRTLSPSDAPAPQGPKRVRAAIQGDPWTLSRTMNGNVGRVRGVNELELLIHSGLTVENDEGVRQALLAETMPTLQNGLWKVFPDGRMETTWRIREGATWHDSTPFTADDLAFTVQVALDREVGVFRQKSFDAVAGVEVENPRTLTVRWGEPFFEADTLFGNQTTFGVPLPGHLLERTFLGEKAAFLDLPYWTADFVGTGPFRVREFVRSSHLMLAANEAYALGRPRIDEVEVRFIQDLNTLVAHILSGEVELTIGRAASVENAVDLRDRWADGKVVVQPGVSWTALYPQHLNPSPTILGNVQMRRALLHAIDRQEIVDVLLHGMTAVAHSMIAPNRAEARAVEASIERYDYDPRRAAEILQSLGFSRGGDSSWQDAAGRRVPVELRSTGGDAFRDKEVLSVSGYWQRLGLEAETVFIPRQRAQDREYRVTRPGFEMVSQGTDLQGLFNIHTRAMPTPENQFSGFNRGRYSSPELDSLIERFSATIPVDERHRVLGQIVRHMTDQLVVMGLYHTPDATVISNRLVNVPAGDPWNSHLWDTRS